MASNAASLFQGNAMALFVDIEAIRLGTEAELFRMDNRARDDYTKMIQPLATPFRTLAGGFRHDEDGAIHGRVRLVITK